CWQAWQKRMIGYSIIPCERAIGEPIQTSAFLLVRIGRDGQRNAAAANFARRPWPAPRLLQRTMAGRSPPSQLRQSRPRVLTSKRFRILVRFAIPNPQSQIRNHRRLAHRRPVLLLHLRVSPAPRYQTRLAPVRAEDSHSAVSAAELDP